MQCTECFIALGGKSEPEFQGFSFIDDPPFFSLTNVCSGACSNTEEFTCLLEYLWFSFKRSQDALVYSYLEEVQHHPPLEGGMIRGTELHPKIRPKGTGKIQMRLLHHYV